MLEPSGSFPPDQDVRAPRSNVSIWSRRQRSPSVWKNVGVPSEEETFPDQHRTQTGKGQQQRRSKVPSCPSGTSVSCWMSAGLPVDFLHLLLLGEALLRIRILQLHSRASKEASRRTFDPRTCAKRLRMSFGNQNVGANEQPRLRLINI